MNPLHISTDQDLVTYFYQQETQYHKTNLREVHLCIKKHFGTNATTKQLYSLIEEKNSNGVLKSIKRKLIIKSSVGILMKNTLMAMKQITSYYMDLIKDVIFISFFFKFLPSRFSIYIFECNLFFLLCFSVSLPGEHCRFQVPVQDSVEDQNMSLLINSFFIFSYSLSHYFQEFSISSI